MPRATLEAIYQHLAEVEGKRLGLSGGGQLSPVSTVYGDLFLPDAVARHPLRDPALSFSLDMWRERHEVAAVLGPRHLVLSKGIKTRVQLPPAPKGEPDPVEGALVAHNHPRREDYAGDLGPSGADLALLLRRKAAGLVLVSPGALWSVGFPDEVLWVSESLLEERQRLLDLVATAGTRCLQSRRYRALKHLAALTLGLLGAQWVRYPKGMLRFPGSKQPVREEAA